MKNNDSYIYDIKITDDFPTIAEPERSVWGGIRIGIGKDCPYKTVEEAFVGHLHTLVAKKDPEKDLREFCESWQSDPNLTDHERETLLGSAYVLARTKRKNAMLQAVKDHNRYNNYPSVKSGLLPEKKHISNKSSEIAQDYSRICNIIEGMQEMQSEQDGM